VSGGFVRRTLELTGGCWVAVLVKGTLEEFLGRHVGLVRRCVENLQMSKASASGFDPEAVHSCRIEFERAHPSSPALPIQPRGQPLRNIGLLDRERTISPLSERR
jgi:hypothetical protein